MNGSSTVGRSPAVVYVLALAATAGWTPAPVVITVLLAGAAVLSMPHGALDVVVGPRLLGPSFFPVYLALAGLTIGVWLLAPTLGLGLFVAMAWYHFGSGDGAHVPGPPTVRAAHGVAAGGAMIAAALWLHTDDVLPITRRLSLGDDALDRTRLHLTGIVLAGVVALGAAVALASHLGRRRWWPAAELVALGVLVIVAHPVVSLVAYFVVVHSLRHVSELDPRRQTDVPWSLVIAASAAPVVAGVALVVLGSPSSSTVTQVAVIGLAALTTPHLVLTEAGRHRTGRLPGQGGRRPSAAGHRRPPVALVAHRVRPEGPPDL